MITLHRLGHANLPVRLNCDLILTIEANPDTVVSLVTGARLVVTESPDEVVAAVRDWRAEIARHTFGVPQIVAPAAHDSQPPASSPVERPSAARPAPAGSDPGGLHSV